MSDVAAMYAQLEQLCLATPTCAGWLLAWAQEGVAGAREELGYGNRNVCHNHIRSKRPGWECDQLALEIDDAQRHEIRAKAAALMLAELAAKEKRREEKRAKKAWAALAKHAAKEANKIERNDFVPNPVVCYHPNTAIVITSDEMDHRLAAEAAARRRKIFWCRSEGQRAKLKEMWGEE